MSDVFISYSNEDQDRAQLLAGVLEQQGLSVWWDRKIPPGRTYDEVIEEALHDAKCVIVLWSATSVTSDWVKTEAADAAQRSVLVPARIEDVGPPLEFRRIQSAELVDWRGDAEAAGLQNLVIAIRRILAGSIEEQPLAAPPPEPPASPSRSTGLTAGGDNRLRLAIGGAVAAVVVVAVALVVLLLGVRGGGGGCDSQSSCSEKLDRLIANIDWVDAPVQQQAPIPPPAPAPLPPIDDFALSVSVPSATGVVDEIFVSTEKSGDATDGWMVDVAEAFNAADIRLENGQQAKIEIRHIASGDGFQFISAGKELPEAYSPSTQIWIEMAEASGQKMKPVREQLVSNVAGIVIRKEAADELAGEVSASAIIDAVTRNELVMAYTNPFIASTGMNFLVTALLELGGGDQDAMLSDNVAAEFRDFSANTQLYPSALIIRDAIERGDAEFDAFVMEYQTFVKAEFLGDDWQFVPYGVPHNNPLYAVGDLSSDQLEALELFAEFAEGAEWTDLAVQYGFDPPAYTPDVSLPSGETLIKAQQVWKENKSGGKQITAVIVSDVSGSMRGERIATLGDALAGGIRLINDDTFVGMIEFSGDVRQVLPIRQFTTEQKGLYAGAVQGMSAAGQTAMYDGIAVGLHLIEQELEENPNIQPLMIVLTDGETNQGLSLGDMRDVLSNLNPCVPVHTIAFEVDVSELQEVSLLCEAGFYSADVDDLEYKIAKILNGEL